MSSQPTPVRTMRAGEIIDRSLKLVRAHLRDLVAAVFAVVLISQVLLTALALATDDAVTRATSSGIVLSADDKGAGTVVLVALASGIVGVLSYAVSQLVCFRILAEGHLGHRVGAGESLRWVGSHLASGIGLAVLLAVLVLLGLALFVLPGVYLIIAFSLAFPVLLVEGRGGMDALSRSRELVSGHWWPTFGRLLLAGLVISIFSGIVGAVLGVIARAFVDADSDAGIVISGVVSLLISLVTTPFLAAVILLVYFDLRLRKEGFDPAEGDPLASPERPAGEAADAFGRPQSDAEVGWSPAPRPQASRPAPEAPRTPPTPPPGWAPPSPGS